MRRATRTVYDQATALHAPSSVDAGRPGKSQPYSCVVTDPWPSAADALGEALHFLELRGAFYCRSEFTAPFGLELPPLEGHLWFHVIALRSCWLEAPEAERRRLATGERRSYPTQGPSGCAARPTRRRRASSGSTANGSAGATRSGPRGRRRALRSRDAPGAARAAAQHRAAGGARCRRPRPQRDQDGLIVYEMSRNRVHYLNATAAVVFALCDGTQDSTSIAELLASAYDLEELRWARWSDAWPGFATRASSAEGQLQLSRTVARCQASAPVRMSRRGWATRRRAGPSLLARVRGRLDALRQAPT